uniref:Uncharacterized protein n=1 Tax=Nelumbo nucifera TaxID=4432 RepID=A0A822ZMP2_NELNU|nr:TPA_asm: hypothetical protein HUJ06_002456 [Nelumbo nucifera]
MMPCASLNSPPIPEGITNTATIKLELYNMIPTRITLDSSLISCC